jgi:hypothetical protein
LSCQTLAGTRSGASASRTVLAGQDRAAQRDNLLLKRGQLGLGIAPDLHLPGAAALDGCNGRADRRMRSKPAKGDQPNLGNAEDSCEPKRAPEPQRDHRRQQESLGKVENTAHRVADVGIIPPWRPQTVPVPVAVISSDSTIKAATAKESATNVGVPTRLPLQMHLYFP